jgi:hypothetical protein
MCKERFNKIKKLNFTPESIEKYLQRTQATSSQQAKKKSCVDEEGGDGVGEVKKNLFGPSEA